eukprot:3402439-Amphidinium_carterae.2
MKLFFTGTFHRSDLGKPQRCLSQTISSVIALPAPRSVRLGGASAVGLNFPHSHGRAFSNDCLSMP